jgi:glycolate oxidase iron-sulfur subunit
VVPEAPADTFRQRAAARPPRLLAVKYRVGYFVSCGFNFLYPDVADATVAMLERAGCAVTILDNTCCGRPAHAYGDLEAARQIARRNVDHLGSALDLDAIVSECGSCSTFLKEYGALLAEDLAYAGPAAALAGRVRSFSEFLASIDLPPPSAEVATRITYHDPCHLSGRFAKVTLQPRTLLKMLPGARYAELPEADWCCGAAGSYTFLHHDRAVGVLERKMRNVERTEATIVATECPACMTHLAYGARRQGLPVQVRHVSQLLAQAYGAAAKD